METIPSAVARAQNRAIAKGTDPKAATCRAKLQRARSALNRQMDRELRLREGAENLLRATTKDGSGGSDHGGVVGGGRAKSKSRKLIRQTVALELSFLESNVRVLADELAELNGSVDVYQHRDDDDDDEYAGDGHLDGFGHDSVTSGVANGVKRRRQRLMPMIAVPLKDTRPIDFRPPLERFIGQHYGVDLSTLSDEGESKFCDNDLLSSGGRRWHSLSLRKAIDELTQLRLDTQTPSRDADGIRLLLRYYRQLYYVDRRFFPPSSITSPMTTMTRNYHQNHHHQQHQQHLQEHHHRYNKHTLGIDASLLSSPPAIYFEWYDSFGGPVPSCGQRTVRFEQACVLFNVAAVHTQMGAKYDRRCYGGRDDEDSDAVVLNGSSPASTGGPADAADGAAAATQCFLRAAGAYRHIGDTFANAPARAADLRATGVLFAVMMAQAHECVFEKLQWRLLTSVRHRCRRYRGDVNGESKRRRQLSSDTNTEGLNGDRYGHDGQDSKSKRALTSVNNNNNGRINDINVHTPSWTELAREAAHLSRMYAEVVYNSCRLGDGTAQGGKENGVELTGTGTLTSVLPEVWVSVCRIKDRHYAALAYRYAACALLPYYRCTADSPSDRYHRNRHRRADETDADELLTELTAAAAAAGLEVIDDDETASSPAVQQQRRRKQIGKLLLEAAAAAHDRAARAQRLCRQLRAKSEGHAAGGGGLLAGVLDRERQRTVRLLLSHRRDAGDGDGDDEYGAAGGADDDRDRCCCRRRRCRDTDTDENGGDGKPRNTDRSTRDAHECYSDDDGGTDAPAVADHGSGDQEEFDGIAGIPGLDVDRGVLIRPRTRFRLAAIAPDFTDTGDGDDDDGGDDDDDDDDDQGAENDEDGDPSAARRRGGGGQRQNRERRPPRRETADREERRADLFAGLGPVAVFSARHRCSRPRWVKVARGGRHRSSGDAAAAVGEDDDESAAAAALDPIQLVDRWFGFELRSHGGGTAAAVPPATVGHVRSNSQAQYAGLRRGDIVVALKRPGDSGNQILDVRWDTCRRVAEIVVHSYQRRRQLQNSGGDGGVAIHLKVVTPITTASDGHATSMAAMDPNKMYSRRRPTPSMASPLQPSPPMMLSQSASNQCRQQRRNSTGGNDTTDSTNKINTWLWNPFRRQRRSVVGNKC